MEANDIIQATQQWAKANGIDSVKVDKVLQNMDMSDFMVFSQAFDTKDYNTIGQLYHQAEANMSESFAYFSGDRLMESDLPDAATMSLIKSMPYPVLSELFTRLPGAPITCEHVSQTAMQTQLFEYGIPTSTTPATATSKPFGAKPQPAAQAPVTPQQAQVQATQAAELEKQAPMVAEPEAQASTPPVNQVQQVASTTPAGIIDPKAQQMADPTSQFKEPQDGEELDIDPEEIMRLAKLAGLM